MIVQEDGAAVPETSKSTVGWRLHLVYIAGRERRTAGLAALWTGAMAAKVIRQEVE